MKIGNLEVYGIIYKVTNNINGKVYIGQTTHEEGFKGRYRHNGDGVERVYKYHKSAKFNNRGYNEHLLRSIEKYGFNNFEVIEILDTAFSREELNIKEMAYICIYDSYKNGYNRTTGGEGQNGMYGELNNNSKPIIQLSLEGEYIKKWNSLSEACIFVGGIVSGISQCLSGATKSAYGYLWINEDEYDINKAYKYKNSVGEYNKEPVVKISLNGEFLERYNSISEASRKNGINTGGILKCCSKERKSYKGFIWVKQSEYNESYNYTYKRNKKKLPRIYKMDSNYNIIRIYNNSKEVFECEGISTKNVSKLCLKHKLGRDGFMWCYDNYYEEYLNSQNLPDVV